MGEGVVVVVVVVDVGGGWMWVVGGCVCGGRGVVWAAVVGARWR